MRASHLAALGEANVYTSMAGLELVKLFARLSLFNTSQYSLTTLLPADDPPMAMDCGRDPDCVVGAFRSLSKSRGSSRELPAEAGDSANYADSAQDAFKVDSRSTVC